MMKTTNKNTRDVTEAYIRTTTRLEMEVFIRPPKELNLPQRQVLKVLKPLYEIPESGIHWYLTYLKHHLKT